MMLHASKHQLALILIFILKYLNMQATDYSISEFFLILSEAEIETKWAATLVQIQIEKLFASNWPGGWGGLVARDRAGNLWEGDRRRQEVGFTGWQELRSNNGKISTLHNILQ